MVEIKHNSTAPLPAEGLIGEDEWNATHTVTLAASPRVVGRTTAGAGAAEELTAGTGISFETGQVVNTAPDQTVVLTGGTGISTSGTYPIFTITNDAPDQTVVLTGGTGITTSGTYPNFTIDADNNGTVTSVTAGTGLTGGVITGTGTVAADIATDANIHAGTASKLIASGQIYTANAPVVTSGTGTYTPDFNAGRVFQRTLTGNSTLANPTNQVAGQSGVIYIIQDATGGRTLSLGANFKPIGGAPSIDTGANKVNVFSYYVRSANNISLSYLGAE